MRAGQALWVTSGRAVLVPGAVRTVAVILPSAVVFSPQGLQATTVMRWLDHSLAARGLIWCGWLALVAPVARRKPDASRRVVALVGLAAAGLVAASLGVQATVLLGVSLTALAIGSEAWSES